MNEPTRKTDEEREAAPASGAAARASAPSADGDAPRKKRRRGRRGGRRHRRPDTAATATAQKAGAGEAGPKKSAEEAAPKAAAGPAAEKAEAGEAAPQKRRRGRRGGRGRGKPKIATAAGATAAGTAAERKTAPESKAAEKPAARPARRRTRGGQTRRKPAAAAEDVIESPTPEPALSVEEAPPRAKAAPRGSTRLAAAAERRKQRRTVRRPRRTLTEAQAAALRGGAKVLLVHEHEDRTQIAVLEESVLIEHYVAHKKGKSIAGNIYNGRVQNVLPGMEAAFVDIGRGRNAVLYAGEVNYSAEDLEGDAPRIEKALRSGQSIMVQVTKDPLGSKGARLTAQVSLPGRYLVLAPDQPLTGISRRLAEAERLRLRRVLREILPAKHGVIVRTAAAGAPADALQRDLANLLQQWEEVQKASKKKGAPALLYQEPEIALRVVREVVGDDFERVVVDSRGMYDRIREYSEATAPELLERLELFEGRLPLFEEFRVVEQIHKALERKVWLPSGGSIVIDRTEAMTVVDVNTGKFVGKSTLEETVLKTNVEAAEEIARQLRLRDIGGIIIIDFIDMILESNRNQVLRTLKRALAKDRTRSQVGEVSSLGLVEMTRKKVSEGLLDAFSEPCPNCQGRGIVLTHNID